MKKKLFLCLGFCLFSAAAVAVVPPELDTPDNRKILIESQKALRDITTLTARFSEFSSKDGDFMKHGTFYLSRPNKMRLIYDAPTQLEFVADGQYFIYHDKSFDQISYLEIDQTPAAILLKPDFSFDDPEFTVTQIQQELDEYKISAIKTGQAELGELTVIVSMNPLAFSQWELVDMKGIKSTVGLYDIEKNKPIPDELFHFQKD